MDARKTGILPVAVVKEAADEETSRADAFEHKHPREQEALYYGNAMIFKKEISDRVKSKKGGEMNTK